MKLGYWGIKGKLEPIRILLAYLKTPYTEENPSSFEEWFGEKKIQKEKDGMPFVNLPYLEDGDFKITESSAIPIYILGKLNKSDLLGSDYKEKANHEMIVGVVNDMTKELFDLICGVKTPEDFSSKGKIGVKLASLNTFVGDNEFCLGKDVRYADMLFMNFANVYTWATGQAKVDNHLEKYPNLKALVKRVSELDGVKQHLASEANQKRPVLPPSMIKI